MDPIFAVSLFLIPVLILLTTRRRIWPSKKLPPGSLGLPIIGQTLSFLRAMRASDKIRAWFEDRVKRYGPVSKLCLVGQPTVFIYGQAANKFVFTGGFNSNTLVTKPPASFTKLIGCRNILDLSGEDHKRMRDALMVFLKPESLKQYVGKMDEEVRRHIQMHWEGKTNVTVLPLMKTLTFDVINSLLVGVERGTRSDELTHLFETLIEGVFSIPFNIPFSTFNRSLKARARIMDILRELIQEKRAELQEKSITSSRQDLITSLLYEKVIPEDEILDNVLLVTIAGYETSATLMALIIRQLAIDPTLLAAVLQEQKDIAKNKFPGELLTWGDLTKMKYTWKVALETLRMFPPVFGTFRKALTDIDYGGYIIPQGWQVLSVTSMTHMEDSIFKEPLKFDPERFDKQAAGKIPSLCFVPFGGGHRMCPGNEFARIETLVTIHYLVTRFTWKLSSKDTTISYAPTPVPAHGLPIEIAPRTTDDNSYS